MLDKKEEKYSHQMLDLKLPYKRINIGKSLT